MPSTEKRSRRQWSCGERQAKQSWSPIAANGSPPSKSPRPFTWSPRFRAPPPARFSVGSWPPRLLRSLLVVFVRRKVQDKGHCLTHHSLLITGWAQADNRRSGGIGRGIESDPVVRSGIHVRWGHFHQHHVLPRKLLGEGFSIHG